MQYALIKSRIVKYPLREITLNKSKFSKEIDDIRKSIIKTESRVRISFLAGLNYEAERTRDSLNLVFNDSIQKQSFSPITLLRAVVGPNLEIQVNELTLKSRCYFKFAISNDDFINVVNFNQEPELMDLASDSKVDYRLEWLTSASLKFNERVSVTGNLRYTHINAPRRQFFIIDEIPELFVADNRFLFFEVGFSYKL